MNTGEEIKKQRKRKNLTQIELAQKADIAVNTLRLYEGGKRQPQMKLLQRLAAALDVPLSAIVEIEPPIDIFPPFDNDDGYTGEGYDTPKMKFTAYYPTEKETLILCMTTEDDTVYIMLNSPMIPSAEKIPWRLSMGDTEAIEAMVNAYFSKMGTTQFSPEIGTGIKVMLNLMAKKSKRQASIHEQEKQSGKGDVE